MNTNFFPSTGKALVLALALAAIGSAQSASIGRAQFDATATSYNFTGAAFASVTATDGHVTATNGIVVPVGIGSTGLASPTYNDGGDASVITFSFSSPVSAFGLDWYANRANPTLSVFDSGNNLLESLTLDWTTFPTFSNSPYGFIGLNAGSNSIAYATIDTPLIGGELFVDNLIYQTSAAAVPEPSTFILLAMGAALLWRRQSHQLSAAIDKML